MDAPAGMSVQVEPDFMILGLGESRTFTVTADVSGVPLDQWYFGNISWQQKFDTHSDANLPLAVYAAEPDHASLGKTANRAFAEPGDTVAYTITLINDAPLTTTFTISDPVPMNASYVPGSAAGGLDYDAVEDELVGIVGLSGVKMELVPDTLHGYHSLPDLGVPPQSCPDDRCDDAAIELGGLDFFYNGRHVSDLEWSTNGYLQVSAETQNLAAPNQNLPDPALPNNILAPLWADLIDGTLYYALVSYGDQVYYVFEWKDAALKSDPDRQYSFQIWIEIGTDGIWFVYGPQTGAITTATVGLENQHGSAGYSYYYNGSGIAPPEGSTLKVIHDVDQANFTYALEMGPTLGWDVTNVVQVTNSRTDRVLQASATVHVSLQIYLPLLIR